MGKIRGNPGARQQEFSPGGVTQDAHNPSATRWDNTCKNLQGNSLETQHPWFLLGAGHIGTHLSSMYQNPRHSEGKNF